MKGIEDIPMEIRNTLSEQEISDLLQGVDDALDAGIQRLREKRSGEAQRAELQNKADAIGAQLLELQREPTKNAAEIKKLKDLMEPLTDELAKYQPKPKEPDFNLHFDNVNGRLYSNDSE